MAFLTDEQRRVMLANGAARAAAKTPIRIRWSSSHAGCRRCLGAHGPDRRWRPGLRLIDAGTGFPNWAR